MYAFRMRLLKISWQLLLLLLLYTVFRFCFYQFNKDAFSGITTQQLLHLFVYGTRFDVSVLFLINILYIFLSLLPIVYRNKYFRKFLLLFFVITNCVAILFEIADWVYFPYNHKRATSEVLNMISRKGDFISVLPGFLKHYWYLFIAAAILIFLFYKINARIDQFFYNKMDHKTSSSSNNVKALIWQTLLLIIVLAFSVMFIRGGFQMIPINVRNAAEVTKSEYTPIALNTPFSIVNTIQNPKLQLLTFYSQHEAEQVVQPIKQYRTSPLKKNVVIIIVESLSKEFTGIGSTNSFTPFLDSLMNDALTFTNAYANALHSNEGIPAITAGIPALMQQTYVESPYSNNTITTIPNLLKPQGYTTAFFHGATNGSMTFDIYSKAAGFDNYYGRTEYNNEADYDGNWGIYDEPFLQFVCQQINMMRQPFVVTEFTLTSHAPYSIPDAYKNVFDKGKLPIQNTLAYTDMAIKKFFESAQKQPWFNNTLFIITADHCSPMSTTGYFNNGFGRYQIPLVLFSPSDKNLKGYSKILAQQIDILPTVMDYVGYQQPFYALGKSLLDTTATNRYVINQSNFVSDIMLPGYALKMQNNEMIAAYSFPADSVATNNIVTTFSQSKEGKDAIRYWKALMQVYTNSILNNQMVYKSNH